MTAIVEPLPPSNRGNLYPSLERVLGVDRLSLVFQVSGFPRLEDGWASKRSGMFRIVECGGATVYMNVFRIGRQVWGKAEWNPSRVLDPNGWGLCSLADLAGTIGQVSDIIFSSATPVLPLELWGVKRIDVARDFQTRNPGHLLTGLMTVGRLYSKDLLLHINPYTFAPESLEVISGKSSGRVSLYSKHAETSVAPEGVLRWEVQARGWAERYGGIKTVGDLNASNIAELAENRWRWSGMGARVVGRTSLAMAIDSLDMTELRKERILGRIWLLNTPGVPLKPSKIDVEVHHLLRNLGMTLPGDWYDVTADRPESELDLARGVEVEIGPVRPGTRAGAPD